MCARSAIIIGIISNAERDLDVQEMILLLILARLHCLWDRTCTANTQYLTGGGSNSWERCVFGSDCI